MVEGPRNPHLSWRELVCLGQEKLLEPEGISGSSGESVVRLAAQGGDGGSHSPDGQLSPKTERTPKDRCHPHKGTHLPSCFQHSAPSHSLHCPTYSSLFTTPLPLGSKRRKALRMASSGSVPGKPREPGEHRTASFPAPPRRSPGWGRSLPDPRDGGGCRYKVLLWAQRRCDRLSF